MYFKLFYVKFMLQNNKLSFAQLLFCCHYNTTT